ncbi:MAG: RNA polymerase factor sigma-54 [Acidobacteria bacterium]|nr:RNA polymerase factor sigma-54 [Acidobacteriota bacterium]
MSSLRLQAKLQQKMVLTPQLRQRIEMLQMTALELNELIDTEMATNPLLEEVQPGDEIEEISNSILDQNSDGAEIDTFADVGEGAVPQFKDQEFQSDGDDHSFGTELDGEVSTGGDLEPGEDSHTESSDPFDEIDYGREFQDYLDPGYKTQEIEYKDDAPSFEQFLTHAPSLSEHLEWQLSMLSLTPVIERAALSVIGNLNADGRLSCSIEEIAATSRCSLEQAELARQEVLYLDPVGCGAFGVVECLLAQLKADDEDDTLAAELVAHHLEDCQPHRLQHLAKSTGANFETLGSEIARIRELDPYPGRRYGSEGTMYVAPEVYIEKVDDDYQVFFTDDSSPRLRISATYARLADQADASKETRDFIKEKSRSAVDLLRNIEHRRQTIFKVVESIVLRQRDFLDNGPNFLKPMMLKDIAEDIGMHLSTISRVVNRKYAHTPQGVIELRRFFSEGMLNEEGEEVSTRILKTKIKKMIEDEDTKRPLTDDEIAKILTKEGVKLSRRTVAKYRDQMQIPGSRERRTIV